MALAFERGELEFERVAGTAAGLHQKVGTQLRVQELVGLALVHQDRQAFRRMVKCFAQGAYRRPVESRG